MSERMFIYSTYGWDASRAENIRVVKASRHWMRLSNGDQYGAGTTHKVGIIGGVIAVITGSIFFWVIAWGVKYIAPALYGYVSQGLQWPSPRG